MSEMFNTLMRTVILDDAAYQEWRERPSLFLRGIVLIAIVMLVAWSLVFVVQLWNSVKPVDTVVNDLEKTFDQVLAEEFPWTFLWQNMDPAEREMAKEFIRMLSPMVVDVVEISNDTLLPRGINGFLQSLGAYLTRVLAALGGWMLYGALVLIAVNLLGGSAKLPDFLGMTSLYAIPALLGLLRPIPCVGGLLVLIGTIWSIVVYIKAVSVASDLDAGRSILAVVAPFIIITLLGILLSVLGIAWLAIVLPSS